MKLSVIIPTFNEAPNIARLVAELCRHDASGAVEILVVDAHSPDGTAELARQAGATVLLSPKPGRAAQMNHGAAHATGDVLYFVHADVSIHPDYVVTIGQAVAQGYAAGCYRFRFDSSSLLLRINSYGTRFKGIMSRGGDQTLFITRELFRQLGGFNERFVVMEDFEIIQRIRRVASFLIVPQDVLVSARKYRNNSWLRVQLANLTAFSMYFLKVAPVRIARTYKAMLNTY
ncbi:TIGR04283 family arsenosugar biosynthesis glycosyltransferase [Hymenobacter negativus]|uniref:TIGR04283 family arsenosugar biosynthesis glycosyltransferase n=1 Tax=Hymenobacter negativus TaxID=2795026 RepID=A0ABS0QE90_9BACT|nr:MULTISPECIES: TIGR04283 family arsenosugar biosynthesis glycosyltransferase [Bacteria]MBH8560501.1 TIGR04283 family arsenosugar biosynthesis glycosyltransferase [Hymenobacter negativus]MBH8570884.1 TIGR04283 family arsenosugar biosynthesis glycosyltransferase [Hymenobacter negativus]MBR7210621.1 TIGR04283 family arsenosugar biosynthesis glycosyltransferase [Microvirga sp. STS02]